MRTLVIIPTYNEIENLPLISGRVRKSTPDVDILVVDDSSPDGTGELADKLAAEDSHIHVLHRKVKDGLLGAYLAGFKYGLNEGYDVLVEMDADGSHAPEELPRLLEQINKGADLVIGSRYVKGGKTVNWPAQREYLSRGGNLYIAAVLGMGYKDVTAGYRAFRRELLEEIDLDSLSRKGYIFQVDMVRKANELGADIREVPVTFVDREYGESKLDGSFVKDSLLEVTKWGVDHWTTLGKEIFSESANLAAHEYHESDLKKVPGFLRQQIDNGTELVKESIPLIKHEIANFKNKKK